MKMKQKVIVLSGAGMSADSGLKTFRDAYGLWEGHDVTEVASPEGFQRNPELVYNFYNQRRKQLLEVEPNAGHIALAELEQFYEVQIITQNVDDLHERAGSSKVLHLHGELLKVRSTGPYETVMEWHSDLYKHHKCPNGYPMRPHIVWFGEEVPLISEAVELVCQAQIILVIGTSMQVYPAAGLLDYAIGETPIYFIDPNPQVRPGKFKNLEIIAERAALGVPNLAYRLMRKAGGSF